MKKTAILLGSKPASVAALLLLQKRGWLIKEVVAAPEQGEWLPSPSLSTVASRMGLRVVENQADLVTEKVDLVISYMCRSLVKTGTLSRGLYPLNFHAGPLPEFGGWAFYNVAILENSNEYGCSCHVMDEGFDTGPLVKVRRFNINPKMETAVSLERKAQLEMLLLFDEVLSIYERSGELPTVPQDPGRMRYLKAAEFAALKEIPNDATEEAIDRIARAFWYPPYEVAFFRTPSGQRLEVIPKIAKQDVAHKLHQDDLKSALQLLNLSLP